MRDKQDQVETLRVLKEAMPEKFDANEDPALPSSDRDSKIISPGRSGQRHVVPQPACVASGSKSDRLEVAKEALSAAERQRKFREKDPEAYRKWNRERMRNRRKSDG